jgi:hypothetical protein
MGGIILVALILVLVSLPVIQRYPHLLTFGRPLHVILTIATCSLIGAIVVILARFLSIALSCIFRWAISTLKEK